MKTLNSIFIFVIILLQSYSTSACFCGPDIPFCQTTTADATIMEVEVIAKYDTSGFQYMDIKVLEVLKTGINEDTLTVISIIGTCDESLGQFNLGDRLIVNPNRILTDSMVDFENFPAINFSSCHTNFLRLSNSTISGLITADLMEQDYEEFKNQLVECAGVLATNEDIEVLEKSISIFPNPVTENVNIDFGEIETSNISLELFSPQGQLLLAKNDLTQEAYYFSLEVFPAGVYFLRVKVDDIFVVKRVVKM